MTSVSGKASAHGSVSTFPRTAKTGRESFQPFENFRIAHVARMNDQVRAFEGAQGLRAQQSMRVRDQANCFGISRSCHSNIMQGDFPFV